MVLDDIAALLEAAGVGTIGVDLIKSGLPPDTDPSTTLLTALVESPGMPDLYVHDATLPSVEYPFVQVLVRGAPYGYEAARLKAEHARQVLGGVHNTDLGATFYLWIFVQQPPFWLRTDQQERPILEFNCFI